MAQLTAEHLREVLGYSPDTGNFQWLIGKKGRPKDGPAGTTVRGRRVICIDSIDYPATHLAFLYMTRHLPKRLIEVDHVNGDVSDDRWSNLRLATKSQNAANSRKQTRKCSTKFKGVTVDKSRPKCPYMAKIKVNQRTLNLGRFSSPEEAHATYMKAAIKYFGEFARAR
jgi:hypothetical protein